MAVAEATRRAGPYETTGGETLLPYGFRILSEADLEVWRQRGSESDLLTYGGDYTLTGVGNAAGGDVVLTPAAVDGDIYVVVGARPKMRATDLETQHSFKASLVNADLDNLQIQIQELAADLSRALKRSRFDAGAGSGELTDAGIGYLYIDENGALKLVEAPTGGGGGAPGGLGALASKDVVAFIDVVAGVVRFDVESQTLAVPPVDAVDGEMWIVPPTGNGAWLGQVGKIARKVSGGYVFFAPDGGWTAYVKDAEKSLLYSPSRGWHEPSSVEGASGGRIVGFFQANGVGGGGTRGWWTADNRIFISGVSTSLGNSDPSGSANWFPMQVPWDRTIGIKRIYTSSGTTAVSHYLIDVNDNVWSWGANGSGQLGHGDQVNRWVPTLIAALSGFTIAEVIPSRANAASTETTLFRELAGQGRVWGCGYGSNYILGNNSASTNILTPIQIGTLTNVVEVAFDHDLAPAFFRRANGEIWVTGGPSGVANGLGTGAAAQVPTQITALANEGIIKMAVGGGASSNTAACLLKSNGTPLVCGQGTYGLGLGNTTTLATFTAITSIPDSEVLDDVKMVGGTGIAIAFRSTAKNLHICGYGGSGIRGSGSTANMLSLVKPAGAFQGTVDEISISGPDGNTALAVRCGDAIWTCGADANAQTAQGVIGAGAAARVWASVQVDGVISIWGWVGGVSTAGLSLVLTDGRARGAGDNTSGRTGTQPGNLHVVSTLQDVRGLPALGVKGDKGDEGDVTAEALAAQVAAEAAATSAAAAAVTAAGQAAALTGTSLTAVPVQTGSATWVTQADRQWQVGQWLLASSGSNWMLGRVAAYSGTSLTIDVVRVAGSGTASSWTIVVSGPEGAATAGAEITTYKTGSFSELLTTCPISTGAIVDSIFYRIGPLELKAGDLLICSGSVEFTNEHDYEAVGTAQLLLASSSTAMTVGYEICELTGGNVRQTTTHHLPIHVSGSIRVPVDGIYWVSLVGGCASTAALSGHLMDIEQDEGGISVMHVRRPEPVYTSAAVTFDGTNDTLSMAVTPKTLIDAKKGLVSGWFNLDASKDGVAIYVASTETSTIRFAWYRNASNKWVIEGRNAAGTLILSMVSASSWTSSSGWHHVLASWDLVTATGTLYINGINDRAASPTLTNDFIDYTRGAFYIGSAGASTGRFAGDMADVYLNLTPFAYYDITSSTLRAFFRTVDGKPANHYGTGRDDTGNAVTSGPPTILLAGNINLFHLNRGRGGDFTVTGALANAATNPSGTISDSGLTTDPAAIVTAGWVYKFDTATGASGVASGYLRGNNATLGSITALYVNRYDQWGNDLAAVLAGLVVGQTFRVMSAGVHTNVMRATLSGSVSTSGNVVTIPVTMNYAAGSLPAETALSVELGGAPGPTGPAGSGTVPMNYLTGLTLSRNGVTPTTKIDMAAGQASDTTNTVLMTSSGVLTIDCATVGANGLDAGTLANSTWYHVWLIATAAGAVAGLISTSVSAPTMPATYVSKRRVGSVRTNGSAQFIAFTQDGDYFTWAAGLLDVITTNPGTAAISSTLTVPTGVNVHAVVNIHLTASSAAARVLVSDLAVTDVAPSSGAAAPGATTGGNSAQDGRVGPVKVRTNTSAQVRYRCDSSDASTVMRINTLAWWDSRGK